MNFLNFRVSDTVISKWERKKTVYNRWYLKLNVKRKSGKWIRTPMANDTSNTHSNLTLIGKRVFVLFDSGKTYQSHFSDMMSSTKYCVFDYRDIDTSTQFFNPEITGWAMGYPKGWVTDVFKNK